MTQEGCGYDPRGHGHDPGLPPLLSAPAVMPAPPPSVMPAPSATPALPPSVIPASF